MPDAEKNRQAIAAATSHDALIGALAEIIRRSNKSAISVAAAESAAGDVVQAMHLQPSAAPDIAVAELSIARIRDLASALEDADMDPDAFAQHTTDLAIAEVTLGRVADALGVEVPAL